MSERYRVLNWQFVIGTETQNNWFSNFGENNKKFTPSLGGRTIAFHGTV